MVVCTLLDLSEGPAEPTCLITDEGGVYTTSDDPIDQVSFINRLHGVLERVCWTAAAQHRGGQGMESGVDLAPLAKKIQSQHRKGQHQQAGARHAAATASLRSPQRLMQEIYDDQYVCELCP